MINQSERKKYMDIQFLRLSKSRNLEDRDALCSSELASLASDRRRLDASV